jgi:hypothetical protein
MQTPPLASMLQQLTDGRTELVFDLVVAGLPADAKATI